jgi:glycosyltransferase involved in cell wall biosynthesis
LAFLLPVMSAGGGGHVVIQEAAAMRRMGVDAVLVNLERHRVVFEQEHPANPIPCLYLDAPRLDSAMLSQWDAVVATAYNSVAWFAGVPLAASAPAKGYYIQDFEPLFFPRRSRHYRKAMDSYTLEANLVRLTKTRWNAEAVRHHVGIDCTVVGPSVDLDRFRPRRRSMAAVGDSGLRIAAMIRPSTPRRAARHTMEVLREFQRETPDAVEIILFGCRLDDADFLRLPRDFAWRHAGVLNRFQLAMLMNEIDVFADFSEFQAMGLTALEAMACGAAVIVPQEGGAGSYARHDENALVVDSHSPEACRAALQRLVSDRDLTARLQRQAADDACQYAPEFAAYRILEALFPNG